MAAGAPQTAQSPLLRIRAGIEAGNPAEVLAGVREARAAGVTIAPNVQDMIKQWLSVNAPEAAAQLAAESDGKDLSNMANTGAAENIRTGEGGRNWDTNDRASGEGPFKGQKQPKLSPEVLRMALLKFFEYAPMGCDAALGLGIHEGEDGARYLPLPMLGRAVGLTTDDEEEIADLVLACIREAPKGVFVLSGYGVGLCEWAGWDEFHHSLGQIVAATRDPTFEPRCIQSHVLKTARGAVRSGHVRQASVLKDLQEKLSPQAMPEDAAPALRSAIARRTRLALACVVDSIAHQGLGPEAGPDSMGLVGQLPRTLFGHIFDEIDDRDRGACAFLGEVLTSWDKRRCFSKRWLQEAAGKFSNPKGVNSEKDEGRGWYALTAENLQRTPPEGALIMTSSTQARKPEEKQERRKSPSPKKAKKDVPNDDAGIAAATAGAGAADEADGDAGKRKKKIVQNDEDDDDTVNKHLEESRKRRAALMEKHKR